MRKFGLLLSLLVLSGCAFYSLVPAGKVTVDDTYTFTTQQDWNTNTQFGQVNLTLDGQGIQQIIATDGIENEKKAFALPGRTLPTYKSSMSPLEVKDFVRDTVAGMGAEQIEETEFRPADFGPWPGFRTEYRYFSKNGLVRRMIVTGTQHNDKLYLIIFAAPELHFFEKHKPEVEYILNSIQAIAKS